MVFWIFNAWKKTYSIRASINGFHKRIIGLIKSNLISHFLFLVFLLVIGLNAIFYIIDWSNVIAKDSKVYEIINYLIDKRIIYPDLTLLARSAVLLLAFILAKWLRTLLFKIAKTLVKPLSYLPSKHSLEFVKRYLKIAHIANYKTQATAYNKLYKMYPADSKFVVLTMDMTYMNLTPPRNYYEQLDTITTLMNGQNKNYKNMIPFIFVDPRRIKKDKSFFKWTFSNGKIQLEDCKLKEYLEDGHFRGVKIYPALGYYPFDEELLPLWLYCKQRAIPITTHCTVGTIYYRRGMKSEWFTHPVFEEGPNEPLHNYARRNIDLQKNFTNPLNYLVLLEPYYLKTFLSKCHKKTQELFGYTSVENDLARDLKDLKINIAHYGGIEQWKKHLESDRLEYAQEILETPKVGIRFTTKQSNPKVFLPYKPADVWKKADWYTVISSMMLQYPNVYADISYILHTPEINSLLNLTLENSELAKKVLFGTDYYVVRNHKSEKELYADMLSEFTDQQFDQIARANPNTFLMLAGETKPLI